MILLQLNLSDNIDAKSHRDTFCNWKQHHKVKGDIAVLLTRRSICESNDGTASCGIVGKETCLRTTALTIRLL